MFKRIALLALFSLLVPLVVYGQQPSPPKTHLKVGQSAPNFSLTDTEGKEVKLGDFKGKKNVVLAFYILAFTGG